jgi:drug/metabolite transporter superfamily protein YnfA
MSVMTIVLIILVLAVIGAFPTWGHSRSWGYVPSGIGGVLIVIVLLLLLTGRVS